jgi:hypothetical protein
MKALLSVIISCLYLYYTFPLQLRDISSLKGHYSTRNVSFYLYPQESAYKACIQRHNESLRQYSTIKHGGEVFWLNQLETSPWRSQTPDDAKLFVIPLHPGWVGRNRRTSRSCEPEYRTALHDIVTGKLFKRHGGKDHIILSTDFYTMPVQDCPSCIKMALHSDASSVATPMVSHLHHSNGAHHVSITERESESLRNQNSTTFQKRRMALFFVGQADGRPAYRSRVRAKHVFDRMNETFYVLKGQGTGRFGHAFGNDFQYSVPSDEFALNVGQTKFGLHIRGDNPTSSRLYEWIDAGCVIVIMSDQIYDGWLPGKHIPWRDMSLQVTERSSDEALEAHLRAVIALPVSTIDKLRETARMWAPMLLWGAPNSVVAETLLIDAFENFSKRHV